MNANGHLNFAMYSTAILGTGYYVNAIPQSWQQWGMFGIGVLIGSLLPDVDHHKSRFGRYIQLWRLKQLHDWIEKRGGKRHFVTRRLMKMLYVFKHGGITHTALINALIYIIGYYAKGIISTVNYFYSLLFWHFCAGAGFGYMTHLYIDHVTGNKLSMLWWPFLIRGKRK